MPLRAEIERLLDEGLALAEIARRLGVAAPTVAYHARRLAAVEPAKPGVPKLTAPRSGRRQVRTRERVSQLLGEGLSRVEIARRLGVSKSTVAYHARRLGAAVDPRGARRYDWAAIQRYYDAGYSVRDCQEQFGFSRQSWHAAVKRGAIIARPHGLPLDELCAAGVHRGRANLRRRLIRLGLKDGSCERCGIREWNGRPLVMALHHMNGVRDDNRIENLELLCPNCHSQTDNYGGRRGAVVHVA